MRKLLALILTCVSIAAIGQEIRKDLKHFTRVVASPRVHVILEKGEQESVRLVYNNVREDQINLRVSGKTLRIFLDDARKTEKMVRREGDNRKVSIYQDVSVTAFITYKELDVLEVRGNQEAVCKDPIDSETFTLRAYGENEIRIASLKTDYFKAKLYGENDLHIGTGRTLEQKYLLYGENKIDTKGLRSDYIVTSIFGEGSLRVNSAEEVRIDAFGEPRIYVDGGAQVHRRLVFGKAYITEEN